MEAACLENHSLFKVIVSSALMYYGFGFIPLISKLLGAE